MSRLIDDIRAAGRLEKPWFVSKERAWMDYAAHLGPILADRSIPVLLIDNVADYYYRVSDQEHWDLTKDFPNLAPPFPAFWTEFKTPTQIHSKEKGDTDLSEFRNMRAGALIVAVDPADAQGEGIPPEVRWILWCELFIDYARRGMGIQGPHGATFLALSADGLPVVGEDSPIWMQSYCAPEHDAFMKNYMTWFNPSFLAISFLHCKNVKIIDNEMDKPLAKKYRARTGVEPAKYKTLIIEPLKEILRTQGRAAEVGIKKALHICRGHFADYTEGRGLFGKYHGKFWIPASVKGSRRKQLEREIEVKL